MNLFAVGEIASERLYFLTRFFGKETVAKVIVKMKIMPTSPDVDLTDVEGAIKEILKKDGSQFHSATKVPIAFGLSSLEVIFLRDESKGNIDDIEEAIQKIDIVESVDTLDVRREFG